MKLNKKAYNIIYRHRRKMTGTAIDTRSRSITVFSDEEINMPLRRLVTEFGFTIQNSLFK